MPTRGALPGEGAGAGSSLGAAQSSCRCQTEATVGLLLFSRDPGRRALLEAAGTDGSGILATSSPRGLGRGLALSSPVFYLAWLPGGPEGAAGAPSAALWEGGCRGPGGGGGEILQPPGDRLPGHPPPSRPPGLWETSGSDPLWWRGQKRLLPPTRGPTGMVLSSGGEKAPLLQSPEGRRRASGGRPMTRQPGPGQAFALDQPRGRSRAQLEPESPSRASFFR